jgi:hypothetical protein
MTTTTMLRDLTYRASATTRVAYDSVRSTALVQAAEGLGASGLAEWPSFAREAFGHLYRPQDAEVSVDAPVSWAQRATTSLLDSPQIEELQQMTRGSRALAGEAIGGLLKAVASASGIDMMPSGKGASDPVDDRADVEAMAELADGEGDPSTVEAMTAAAKAAGKRWGEAAARRRVVEQRMQSGNLPSMTAAAVATTVKSVKAKAEAMAIARGLMAGAGIDERVLGDDGLPDALVAMIMNDARMRDVIAMLGRLKANPAAAWSSDDAVNGSLDVVGITMGDDPRRLVVSELAMLGHPLAKYDVLMRMAEKQATVRSQRGEEPADRGDFFLLVDKSGSMWGENIVLARAIAMAAMLTAIKDRRRVSLVMFDTTVKSHVVVQRGGAGIHLAFQALAMTPGGGTDGVAAIHAALRTVNEDERKRTDVVMVTDGEWTDGEHGERTASIVGPQLARNGGGFHELRIIGDGDYVKPKRAWMTSLTPVTVDDDGGACRALKSITKVTR